MKRKMCFNYNEWKEFKVALVKVPPVHAALPFRSLETKNRRNELADGCEVPRGEI